MPDFSPCAIADVAMNEAAKSKIFAFMCLLFYVLNIYFSAI